MHMNVRYKTANLLMSEMTALTYFTQLLLALEHIHSFGVPHKSIDRNNVFISTDHSTMLLGSPVMHDITSQYNLFAGHCMMRYNMDAPDMSLT